MNKMKKILLLILVIILTGCKEESTSEKVKNMQNSSAFMFYVDRESCVEYILFINYEKVGLSPRYSADGSIKLNEICVKNKEK